MILFVFLNKHHPQGSFIAIVLGHKNLKLNLFKVPPLGNWGRGRYSYFISVVPEDNYVEMGYTRSPVQSGQPPLSYNNNFLRDYRKGKAPDP